MLSLETLPDDILYIILDQASSLRYAARHFHRLAEELDHHNLQTKFSCDQELPLLKSVQTSVLISHFLADYSYSVSDYLDSEFSCNISENKTGTKPSRQHSLSLPSKSQSELHSKTSVSSRALRAFLSQQYCFFAPEHVVSTLNIDIPAEERAQAGDHHHDVMDPNTTHLEINTNTTTSSSLTLNYRTRLAPGRYEAYVHLTTENAFRLLPVRFSVKENSFVRQAFPPYPPSRIAIGSHDMLSANANTNSNLNLATRTGLGGSEIYMGDLTVVALSAYNKASCDTEKNQKGTHPEWPEVEFEISGFAAGTSDPSADIQFNYLRFIPKSPTIEEQLGGFTNGLMTPPRSYWEIVPKAALASMYHYQQYSSSSLFADAYEQLNEIKLACEISS